jgi:ribonuclease HII
MTSEIRNDLQAPVQSMLLHEHRLYDLGMRHVAGIDEAGRGPLAGPVVAAAVIFPRGLYIEEVNDSKQLTAQEREELYTAVITRSLSVGIGVVDNIQIDRMNILNATYQAMHKAVGELGVSPDHLLIDGNRFQPCGIPFSTIVDGDALSFSIAAASIVAKVTRDRMMIAYDILFPGYGFARHKGYGTRLHKEAILRLGYCDLHRRSFALNTQEEFVFEDTDENVEDQQR